MLVVVGRLCRVGRAFCWKWNSLGVKSTYSGIGAFMRDGCLFVSQGSGEQIPAIIRRSL